MFGAYCARLVPRITTAENLQNWALEGILLLLGGLAWRAPAAYAAHSPPLRLLFLCFAYAMPFYASLNIMQATTPAPSPVGAQGGAAGWVGLE